MEPAAYAHIEAGDIRRLLFSSALYSDWNHLGGYPHLDPFLFPESARIWSHFEGGTPVWIHFCLRNLPAYGAISRGYPHLDPFSSLFTACNWNHFDVRLHLVPISSLFPACNWNHFDVRLHLVPISSLFTACNWNHFDVRLRLVPISSLFTACNWNHFDVPLHLVPIYLPDQPGSGAFSRQTLISLQFSSPDQPVIGTIPGLQPVRLLFDVRRTMLMSPLFRNLPLKPLFLDPLLRLLPVQPDTSRPPPLRGHGMRPCPPGS